MRRCRQPNSRWLTALAARKIQRQEQLRCRTLIPEGEGTEVSMRCVRVCGACGANDEPVFTAKLCRRETRDGE